LSKFAQQTKAYPHSIHIVEQLLIERFPKKEVLTSIYGCFIQLLVRFKFMLRKLLGFFT